MALQALDIWGQYATLESASSAMYSGYILERQAGSVDGLSLSSLS